LVGLLSLAGSRWSAFVERLYDLPGQWASRNVIARQTLPGETGKLGNWETGPNFLISQLPDCPKAHHSPLTTLVFLAHYDSKSQLQPLVLRLALFLMSLFGLGVLAALLVLAAWRHPAWITPHRIWSVSGVSLLAIALLQLNYSHNVSPGALDNACGVGVLLELARCLSELERPDLNLLFVATGAEEEGLAGAMRFMQAYGATFDPARSWFVNLDGPGAEGQVTVLCRYGLPPIPTGPRLTQALLTLAAERGISAGRGYLPLGAGTDQMPIAWRGFEAVTLESVSFGRAWFSAHSRHDTLEHISRDALQRVGDLCVELAQRLRDEG
jgi:hypothetical protein